MMERGALRELARLASKLQGRPALEDVLRLVAETAGRVLGVERASVRLLDADRQRLIAIARAGQPLHEDPNTEFVVGEGLMGWIVEHAETIRIEDAEHDPRFAARPGVRDKIGAFVGVPLLAGTRAMGVLSALRPTPPFSEEDEDLLVLLATIAGPHVEIARLSRLSRVDRLTGALNRRGLDAEFPEIVTPDDGVVEPLSVVMVDIDHFKAVNDEHGHAVGDGVLGAVAHRLSDVVRGGDAVVRYGGEEFLLILPRVGASVAARVADRARRAVARPIVVDDRAYRVTISAGVAERAHEESRKSLIDRADAAMYRAKRAGRDRVELADPPTASP